MNGSRGGAELGCAGEVQRDHSEQGGLGHVGRIVVNVHGVARRQGEALQEDPEDRGIGLADLDLAREEDAIHARQERIQRPSGRKRLGRPVAQGVGPKAGPPELEDEQQCFTTLNAPQTQTVLASEDAAQHGAQGGQLRVVDKASGNTISMYSVNFLPVWDGMAASRNSVYLATLDGRVICMR